MKSCMWTADKNVNMKAIFAVMNTTWAVVKIRPDFSDHFYYYSSSIHYCEDRFHIRIFYLVMHWSRGVVFGAWATTAQLYPGRDSSWSEYILIWSGERDQESTNHYARLLSKILGI